MWKIENLNETALSETKLPTLVFNNLKDSVGDGGGGEGGALGKEEISAKRQRGGEQGSGAAGECTSGGSEMVGEGKNAGIK